MSKNLKFKLEVTFIILIWLFTCNGGFAQSFFPAVTGSCAAEGPVELGTKFTTSANATITALRFYKCKNDNNPYELKLYGNGNFIKAVIYQGTATGWISVPATINIVPGVNYVVSYYSPGGFYQAIATYSYPVKNGTLTATGSAYKYGGGLPNLTYQTSNYFADVVVQAQSTQIHDTVYVDKPVYIHDTMYLTKPTEYIHDTSYKIFRDTIYLPKVCPTDSQHYFEIHDTIYLQSRDTTHFFIGYGGLDTIDYKLYNYRNYKIREFFTYDGKRERYVHRIDEVIKHEEYDETLGQWIEK